MMDEAVFRLIWREGGDKVITLDFGGYKYEDPAFDSLLCIKKVKQGVHKGEPYFVLSTNYGEEGFYFGSHDSSAFPQDVYNAVAKAATMIEEVIEMTPFMSLSDFDFYVRTNVGKGITQVEVHDRRGKSQSKALFVYNKSTGKFDERQSTFSKDSKRFWEAKYLVERNMEFFVEKVVR